MKDDRWVVCPLCGRGRKLLPGNKGQVSFSSVDPKTAPCMDFRDISGGYGSGFPRIGTMSIEEMKQSGDTRYMELLAEIKGQAERIVEAIGDVGEIEK